MSNPFEALNISDDE